MNKFEKSMDTPDRSLGKDFEGMSFSELERDSRYRDTLEEVALEYLKTKDEKYLYDRFTGEVDKQGYLIQKDGGNPIFLPSHHFSGGPAMEEVLKKTKERLKKELGDE